MARFRLVGPWAVGLLLWVCSPLLLLRCSGGALGPSRRLRPTLRLAAEQQQQEEQQQLQLEQLDLVVDGLQSPAGLGAPVEALLGAPRGPSRRQQRRRLPVGPLLLTAAAVGALVANFAMRRVGAPPGGPPRARGAAAAAAEEEQQQQLQQQQQQLLLQQLLAEADSLRSEVPEHFAAVAAAYKEHCSTISRRYREALSCLYSSKLVSAAAADAAENHFLLLEESWGLQEVQQTWTELVEKLTLQMTPPEAAEVSSLAAALVSQFAARLELLQHECATALAQQRRHVAAALQQHELAAAAGGPLGDPELRAAQQFLSQVAFLRTKGPKLEQLKGPLGALERALAAATAAARKAAAARSSEEQRPPPRKRKRSG
ncbi:hypothetical protein, conserved [Eimeria tenella]|uniref:Uncharacterized protein n=1 Tax=Eimeria tenella TaxID=5802 RepID=U6KP24_EIMTE|nr:hypothetical protein, conserved [Eimeria tenella]CDJ37203.1 hypothetical protein, conserved [Eimeria tenella]|eukprot:XP_013228041.1 hypothetical protein, conserved [Eimeria tenella]